ncbi:MAG TPA: sigma-70 family RNA polymerase sigma factor [Rhizomicrobium sp.]|nr:sigma-70 family RNA polymerase sigma factor [Rhizomicrobium sp.]
MMAASEVELWFVQEVLPMEASLMRFLRNTYRNPSELADLRQDIYAELIESAQKKIPNPTKPFVFSVARNVMVSRIRRERIVPMKTLPDMDALALASDAPHADRALVAREELQHVRAAMDRLSPRCREAVMLARVEGLSGREIATRLNLSESTVSDYVKKGMRQIADMLYGTRDTTGGSV